MDSKSMTTKQKALVVSMISFAITFLSLVLAFKLATKTTPALANGDWFEDLFFGPPPSYIVHPTTDTWIPPSWFPQNDREKLFELEGLRKKITPDLLKKGPRIKARAAIVYDLDRGEILYAKNPDERWPVASLTKVVSALTLASFEQDNLESRLGEDICMDRTLYANFPGAITKFRRDTCVKGWDLLGAALVKSDNGGAFAMADIADVTHGPFIDQMNTVAQDLGMTQSEFVDPAGVNDENLSTARDMTMATIASGHHEIIHIPASASQWDAKYKPGQSTKRLYSTNRYSQAEDIEFYTAKTGYTSTARNCFTAVFTKKGRRLAVTTLGTYKSSHRWSDFNKLVNWSLKQ